MRGGAWWCVVVMPGGALWCVVVVRGGAWWHVVVVRGGAWWSSRRCRSRPRSHRRFAVPPTAV
eukprot:3391996-Pyramimonas_sp.AAC.1